MYTILAWVDLCIGGLPCDLWVSADMCASPLSAVHMVGVCWLLYIEPMHYI